MNSEKERLWGQSGWDGTHPPRFTLILECLLGVLSSSLHVVHSMLHMVLYAVNHLALRHKPITKCHHPHHNVGIINISITQLSILYLSYNIRNWQTISKLNIKLTLTLTDGNSFNTTTVDCCGSTSNIGSMAVLSHKNVKETNVFSNYCFIDVFKQNT